MAPTKVCVAAVDLQRLTMVRLLPTKMVSWPINLVHEGLKPGCIVRGKLGLIKANLGFPHCTEDIQLGGEFKIRKLISEADLYSCVAGRVDECVADIFANNVCDKKYVIDGTQCRSLGSVLVDSASMALVGGLAGKWRLLFKDAAGQRYNLPLTDLRVIGDPSATVARLAAAECDKPILLRIGLARGFDGFGKFLPKRCYLQVNGIVFPD